MWDVVQLRREVRLFIAAEKQETDPRLKRSLAGAAFALAQLAEMTDTVRQECRHRLQAGAHPPWVPANSNSVRGKGPENPSLKA